MTKTHVKNMTTGRPVSLILAFVFPSLAGMLFQQLYNLVDTMIVGRTLGVDALAGVGSTASVNFLVLGFCMGVCSGFCIPVARCFGAGKEKQLKQFVGQASLLGVVFATMLTLLTVSLCRTILTAMGTPDECFVQAETYILVIFAGIPFTFLYNLCSGWISALGDSKTPLAFLILSSFLNIALDFTFILIFHLGVLGASLATVISQAISGLLCLYWIRTRYPMLHISLDDLAFRPQCIQELCRCGLPMGLQYSITAIGSIILQSGVNQLGAASIAAMTAGKKMQDLLAVPLNALGPTMATYCAQNTGASKPERLTTGVLDACGLGIIYSLLAVLTCYAFGSVFASLFITGEGMEDILSLTRQYMLFTTMGYPLLTLVNVVRFSIQGMGFSIFAMLAGVMEMIARSSAGMFLIPNIGFFGASISGPLAWFLADLFLIPAYLHCFNRLTGHTSRDARFGLPVAARDFHLLRPRKA